MVALYLTATAPGAGKTAICAGLGKHLQNRGKKVSYFKPVTARNADSDARFMKQVLALSEAEDVLSPVINDLTNAGVIKEAYDRVAKGKDVVIVEGMADKSKDNGIVAALDARVVMVVGYTTSLPVADVVAGGKELGKHLLGVVVNRVPRHKVDKLAGELSAPLGAAGIKLLGVLPQDRALSAVTVAELAQRLGGDILNNADKTTELVENYMMGALGVDSGLIYFGRKLNKAVIARAGRPDIQLAALETPTRCLIVTDNKAPAGVVMRRAQEKQVPIIQAKDDVDATVAGIEEALAQSRFNQERKLPRLSEIMAGRFNFKSLEQGLAG